MTLTRPSAAGAAPARSTTAPAHGVPAWAWTVSLVALAGLAFLVRYRLLVHSGGLLGTDGYDDGVYYAAADAMAHGLQPYRDFLLLQPPGPVLALLPFAWLGSVTTDPSGEVLARLVFIGVGAVNTVLVALIGRRFGGTAAVLAGVGYAVFLPAAYAERSTLLEPLGTCGLLVAVLLAAPRLRRPGVAMVLAGAAAGVATGMRIWYVVPAAVIAIVVAAPRRGALLRFGSGAAAAALAIYLPFFLTDPGSMLREVVLDQLGRRRGSTDTPLRRIDTYLGALPLHLPQPWSSLLSVHEVGLALAIVAVVLAVAACTVRGARVFPIAAAASAVVLLASPTAFLHYGALTAPWLVLSGAIGAARLLSRIRAGRTRVLVGTLVLLAFAGVQLRADQGMQASAPVPVAALRPAAQRVPGCVLADDPQALIALDVLSHDYRIGCAIRPDVTGYTYDRDAETIGGRHVARVRNRRWQEDVTRYLLSGDAVVVHRAATALSRSSDRLVRSGPVLARSGEWTLHAVVHGERSTGGSR